jgi:hypothetical protein
MPRCSPVTLEIVYYTRPFCKDDLILDVMRFISQGEPVDSDPPIRLRFCGMEMDPTPTSWPNYYMSPLWCFYVVILFSTSFTISL